MKKNFVVIFSIIAIPIALIVLFIVWQSKESYIVELSPKATGYITTTTTSTSVSFGALKNIYNDKQFNFSLEYPDEVGIAQVQKSCHMDLYLMDTAKGYPPLISLYNPSCPSPFANLSARSLDDYKKDYTLDNGVIVSIVNTENIFSSQELHGIRQEYFIFSNDKEMQNSNLSARTPSVRYVFYNKEKGFYILQVAYFGDAQNFYKELERNIVKTVKY